MTIGLHINPTEHEVLFQTLKRCKLSFAFVNKDDRFIIHNVENIKTGASPSGFEFRINAKVMDNPTTNMVIIQGAIISGMDITND